jgi:putative transposase
MACYAWSMNKSSNFRAGRSCVFLMHVHLVFVTKYRKKVFTKQILEELKTIFSNICKDFDSVLIEFDGEGDHVHLLINYPPKITISKLVNSLKGVSSRLLRKGNFPSIQNALWGNQLWSPSYFASSCGGAPLEIVKKYIEKQKTPN